MAGICAREKQGGERKKMMDMNQYGKFSTGKRGRGRAESDGVFVQATVDLGPCE